MKCMKQAIIASYLCVWTVCIRTLLSPDGRLPRMQIHVLGGYSNNQNYTEFCSLLDTYLSRQIQSVVHNGFGNLWMFCY